ncbi:MAG TPA: hypothetical protein VIR54_32640 [Vicinamibacterales bacterium]
MPWWIAAYLVSFAMLGVAGLWDDYTDRRPGWFLACSVVANVTVIYLFVALWQPSLRSQLGMLAPVAFIASVCWEWFQAIEDIRSMRTNPELSEAQPSTVATATVVMLVICLPAFAVAGISAFKE